MRRNKKALSGMDNAHLVELAGTNYYRSARQHEDFVFTLTGQTSKTQTATGSFRPLGQSPPTDSDQEKSPSIGLDTFLGGAGGYELLSIRSAT